MLRDALAIAREKSFGANFREEHQSDDGEARRALARPRMAMPALPLGRDQSTSAFSTATCIGCGGWITSCRNASASLFLAAKLAHLDQVPHGQPERASLADTMQRQMEAESFGSRSSKLECEAVCPQEISTDWISWMHRERRS